MILETALSLLAVAGFGLVLWRAKIPAVARGVIGATATGVGAMLDSALDDDAKEVAVRRAGFKLIGASFNIAWRFVLALAAAAAPILIADVAGVVSSQAVFDLMLRLDYIVVVSVLVMAGAALLKRVMPARETAPETPAGHPYSEGDQVLHMLAFASPAVLKASSNLEDRLLSKEQAQPAAPIFVTSLARGGTTALLNALYDMPEIATHAYRDMPFLTAPILWDRLAGGAKRAVDRRQRAHGDGLEIDLDSPEAFEEVIWKLFWAEKFAGDSIELWSPNDAKPEAEGFFRRHMQKIIRTRGKNAPGKKSKGARYCSKNNANIARLSYLPQAFPGCRIVMPVRRPECHAASLLRQHENFCALQGEDDFVKRYMSDIGHFEFGLIHQPISFPGFQPDRFDRNSPDYWLDYWICAFRYALAHSDDCIIVAQDDLRQNPQKTMSALSEKLDLDNAKMDFQSCFRATPDEAPTGQYAPQLYEEAAALYEELRARAI